MILEDVLARIPDLTGDHVLVTDAAAGDDGARILYANPALLHRMGYTAAEVIGRSPRMFQGPDTAAEARGQMRDAITAGRPVSVEILNYAKSGEEVWCEIRIFPVPDDTGEVRYFAAIQRETTLRHQQENELRQARAIADAASKAKGNFLAHMSHELRTPLNAIIGFSEIINQQIFGPLGNDRYVGYAGDILLSASHLLDIVNDVLDMSRIETGRIGIEESEFELDELLDESRRIVGSHAERAQVQLEYELQAPFRIRADRRLIKQCLVNLISNAVKFTEAGGRTTLTALLLADGQLALIVNDTGIGIPSDKVLEAMEPYVSVDRRGNQATRQGAGLGLPITKAFTELHGGKLFINSEIGAGTSVFLTLPARRVLSPALAEIPLRDDMLDIGELEAASPEALDRLPLGVLKLDADGRILAYNATESRFSGFLPEEVLGRNFFTEVAPCTSVSEFRDVFRAGVAAGRLSAVMSYVFHFPKRPMRVVLDLRCAKEPGQGWVFVRWL